MDVLKSLFGNVTSSILRLGVIAGTLALLYVFAIRPALDTTEELGRQAIEFKRSVDNGQGDIFRSIREAGIENQRVERDIQRDINRALRRSRRTGGGGSQDLLRCIQRAKGDVAKMQACSRP